MGLAALAWAGMSALVHDLATSQTMRSLNSTSNGNAEELADQVLVITPYPYRFMPQLLRKDSHVAFQGSRFAPDTQALVDSHLERGYRVFIDGGVSGRLLAGLDLSALDAVPTAFGQDHLIELRRAP
jgi:hypothetical protein